MDEHSFCISTSTLHTWVSKDPHAFANLSIWIKEMQQEPEKDEATFPDSVWTFLMMRTQNISISRNLEGWCTLATPGCLPSKLLALGVFKHQMLLWSSEFGFGLNLSHLTSCSFVPRRSHLCLVASCLVCCSWTASRTASLGRTGAGFLPFLGVSHGHINTFCS